MAARRGSGAVTRWLAHRHYFPRPGSYFPEVTTMSISSIAPAVRAARRLTPAPLTVRVMNSISSFIPKPLSSTFTLLNSTQDLAHDAGSRPERNLRQPVAIFLPSRPRKSFVARARRPSVLPVSSGWMKMAAHLCKIRLVVARRAK